METTGRVLRGARWYDIGVWLATAGNEAAFREQLLSFADLRPGERVLDVGCGTGTLAIAAKRAVGSSGEVTGVDASSEMIAYARTKAAKAGVPVIFTDALAERLPFAARSFDVVLATLMLHHLPAKTRARALGEFARVLKPQGRIFVADYESSGKRPSGILGLIHKNRHGHIAQDRLQKELGDAGLSVTLSQDHAISGIHVTVATLL